jgi:hypothetical protein
MSDEKSDTTLVLTALGLVYQTGFGFQAGGTKEDGHLVICFVEGRGCGWDDDLYETTQDVRQALGTPDVSISDFIGHTYASVHWRLYARIPEIIQCLLNRGMNVTLQTHLKLYYKAGSRFDPRGGEAQYVKWFLDQSASPWVIDVARRNGVPPEEIVARWGYSFWRQLCPCNWQTAEGKAFCTRMRAILPFMIDHDAVNVYETPIVREVAKKYRLLQYSTWWYGPTVDTGAEPVPAPRPVPVAVPAASDEDLPECMICNDNFANTLVLPCGHQVVCAACSAKLKNTPDHHTCVRCRVEITDVLSDHV